MGLDGDLDELRDPLAIGDIRFSAARAQACLCGRVVTLFLGLQSRSCGAPVPRLACLLAARAWAPRCVLPLAPRPVQRPRQHRTGRAQRVDFACKRCVVLFQLPVVLLRLVELATQPSDLDAQRGHRRALAGVHTGIVEQPRQPAPVRLELQRMLRCPAHPRKLLTRCMQLRSALLEQRLVGAGPAARFNLRPAKRLAARLGRVGSRAVVRAARRAVHQGRSGRRLRLRRRQRRGVGADVRRGHGPEICRATHHAPDHTGSRLALSEQFLQGANQVDRRTITARPNAYRRLVARGGIEPPTRGFSVRCSTN